MTTVVELTSWVDQGHSWGRACDASPWRSPWTCGSWTWQTSCQAGPSHLESWSGLSESVATWRGWDRQWAARFLPRAQQVPAGGGHRCWLDERQGPSVFDLPCRVALASIAIKGVRKSSAVIRTTNTSHSLIDTTLCGFPLETGMIEGHMSPYQGVMARAQPLIVV